MADDTRQSPPNSTPGAIQEDFSRSALTVHPENKPFAGTQWQGGKQIPYTPSAAPENANALAGGTEHTAGGKAPDVTVGNAFQNGLQTKDFLELPKRPCVRDALMTGIGGGFAFGGIRAIFGAAVWTSCSTAVAAFCLSAPAMYQFCHYKRQAEKEGMMRAVEILNKKEVDRKARESRKEKVREERRLAKDKEQDSQLAALSPKAEGGGKAWWKVW
ncbi:hypothetical protein LTR62_002524 [Meristemomyces frigidus]|uniref:Cytochrome c oxidase assembly protein COX20, mitochondrial n=1 Tax=Meristemomyces frigidus TaxID=1508187 RepID=A0AAN7YHD5_9PEZI|nr:hypothetical protein LTR62_002524 [Meristemomyces frigidus]